MFVNYRKFLTCGDILKFAAGLLGSFASQIFFRTCIRYTSLYFMLGSSTRNQIQELQRQMFRELRDTRSRIENPGNYKYSRHSSVTFTVSRVPLLNRWGCQGLKGKRGVRFVRENASCVSLEDLAWTVFFRRRASELSEVCYVVRAVPRRHRTVPLLPAAAGAAGP